VMDDECTKKCRKHACVIQACLQRNGYDSERCSREITLWNTCCDAAKAPTSKAAGPVPVSTLSTAGAPAEGAADAAPPAARAGV